jgi:small subunit ribosomal protein S2
MTTKLLIPKQDYLAAGIHIGMKQRTDQMKEFIYKIREDGLAVLDLKTIDDRIKVASKFLSRCEKILVVTRKAIAKEAIQKFAEAIKATAITTRFMPGTLTNPTYKKFYEADAIVLADPLVDIQALQESVKARVPIIAVCDTFNETKDIDLIIPANNKGKKSLGLLFWVLAREVQKERGVISSDKDFEYKIEDFGKDTEPMEREYSERE